MKRGLLSSGNRRRYYGFDGCRTPDSIYRQLDAEFHFTCDAAADEDNAKHRNFFSQKDSAFDVPWEGVVFCNPPYSDIGAWMAKAWLETRRGVVVVLLVPVRSDLGWFHEYALRGEIRFIRGRVKFGGMKHSAPFPSCVVILRPTDV